MNFGESLHIWRMRWKLTIVLLVLALAGTVAAFRAAPRSYQSQASVVLLASRSAARLTGGNPYLSFSPSLNLTADALSRELMAPATSLSLAARGFVDSYAVALPTSTTTTTGSVLLVTVAGSRPAAVQSMLAAVTRQIRVELQRLQIGVKPKDRIRAATLSFSPQATLSVSKTIRPLVAVLAVGLLLSLGIPVVVDGRISRRRQAKAAAAGRGPEPDLAPDSAAAARPAAGPAGALAATGQLPADLLPQSRNGAVHGKSSGRPGQSAGRARRQGTGSGQPPGRPGQPGMRAGQPPELPGRSAAPRW
jgi:hypothetical protein